MENRFLKILMFMVIIFSSFFLFNIDKAKADCDCYYTTSVPMPGTAVNYFIHMSYGPNKADVVEFCSYTNGTSMQYFTCGNNNRGLDRGKTFNVNSENISNQNCSVNACQSANLYFLTNGNGQLSTVAEGSYYGTLKAIDRKQYNDQTEEAQESDAANERKPEVNQIESWGKNYFYAGTSGIPGDPCKTITNNPWLVKLLSWLFWFIAIAGLAIFLIMSVAEFIKAITSSDADATLKNAFKHLLLRVIVVVILFLLPTLLNVVINFLNDNLGKDGTYKIGSDGNLYCDVINS